mgnify:CR=1 FL=1
MKKILFITGQLNAGGAERVLIDILRHFDYIKYQVDLCQIIKGGTLIDEVPTNVNIYHVWDAYTLHYKLSYRASNQLEIDYFIRKKLKQKITEKYDVVILDPPAFTKSREATKNAIKGYREINMKGLKLVKDGGYFATCSCSHFMTQELLTKTIKEAAKATHKRLRQIEFRTQSPDHPILWAADESYYLKFYIFQVVDEK